MKITTTLAERIVTAVEETHLPLSRIGPYCGITDQTLRNWLRDGEECYKQLEDGKIKESDLKTKQKKELDLYLQVENARAHVESGYLQRKCEIAEEKRDIKVFQWLLKIQNPFYADVDSEDVEAASESEQAVVVHLNDCGSENAVLISEFLKGVKKKNSLAKTPAIATNPDGYLPCVRLFR